MLRHPNLHRRPWRHHLTMLLATVAVASAGAGALAATSSAAPTPKPTIVLEHGAFADASGWTGVITRLESRGYDVVAPANPLRGVASDAAYLRAYLGSIKGPIVLVGHSYGGFVITNAATGNADVKALVYIAGFAPDAGDSIGSLGAQVPGGQISEATLDVTGFPTPTGEVGLEATIKRSAFRRIFAADLPAPAASAMAAAQRPAALATLGEPSGVPAWKTIKSYALVPGKDLAIGAPLLRFMAKRAHATTVEVRGASHAVLVSQPAATTDLVLRAARETRVSSAG